VSHEKADVDVRYFPHRDVFWRACMATNRSEFDYFPAVIVAEYDSPIDALIGLSVARDEAMDLVAAAWAEGAMHCVLARVDGGRQVAAVPLPGGRWAACKAFTEPPCASPREAERRLVKLLKGGRRGTVGTVPKGRFAG
jgi:hypothetical protein